MSWHNHRKHRRTRDRLGQKARPDPWGLLVLLAPPALLAPLVLLVPLDLLVPLALLALLALWGRLEVVAKRPRS